MAAWQRQLDEAKQEANLRTFEWPTNAPPDGLPASALAQHRRSQAIRHVRGLRVVLSRDRRQLRGTFWHLFVQSAGVADPRVCEIVRHVGVPAGVQPSVVGEMLHWQWPETTH